MKYLCFLVTYLSVSSAAPSLEANTRDHRRIFGGDEANIKDFKYMGALLFEREYRCGAALISHDTVVTAAHCFLGIPMNTNKLSVRFGSPQWRSGGQEIFVKQVIIHENYDPSNHPANLSDYDIAVVKLTESVKVANAVPIDLAKQVSPTGTMGTVSGWGMTEYGIYPETLRKVQVTVYDHTQCRDLYRNDINITNNMICTGYKEDGRGACDGDSGGPYVINGQLVGVVSIGDGDCGTPGNPGVYASIPAFYDWIERHA